MMYSLDPAVHAPVFAQLQHLIPPPKPHPLGCHRRRVPDHVCFMAILLRHIHGMSWESTEHTMRFAGYQVSDTTLRTRRNEWVDAGVFELIAAAAINGYRRLIGLDLTHVSIDASDQLAPCGGSGTGIGFKTHGRLGWKWTIAVDANGIPFGFTIDPANRNDYPALFDLLDQLQQRDLTTSIGTLHADRGYGYPTSADRTAAYGITNFCAPSRNQPRTGTRPLVGLGQRWIVEATNAWLCAYGQLKRNTDRRHEHRHAALCLAIALLITHRLQQRTTSPIR
jgi:hypothetical protein